MSQEVRRNAAAPDQGGNFACATDMHTCKRGRPTEPLRPAAARRRAALAMAAAAHSRIEMAEHGLARLAGDRARRHAD
jgi:hypothetical protein